MGQEKIFERIFKCIKINIRNGNEKARWGPDWEEACVDELCKEQVLLNNDVRICQRNFLQSVITIIKEKKLFSMCQKFKQEFLSYNWAWITVVKKISCYYYQNLF